MVRPVMRIMRSRLSGRIRFQPYSAELRLGDEGGHDGTFPHACRWSGNIDQPTSLHEFILSFRPEEDIEAAVAVFPAKVYFLDGRRAHVGFGLNGKICFASGEQSGR